MADGSTKYLSEIRAGDSVKIVSADEAGFLTSRSVTVGRCKIEPRPMLLVEFIDDGTSNQGQIFLQQAETVRLMSPISSNSDTNNGHNDDHIGVPTGRYHVAKSVTDLKIGDKISVMSSQLGTHVGKRIISAVEEK